MSLMTVILPTFNRAAILEVTLRAFENMVTKRVHWELIVIDNASTDHTKSVVESFSTSLPIVYLYEPTPGKNNANNRGIEYARGDLLVFCDDDITPVPDWLEQIAAASKRWPSHSIFGGRVLPVFPPRSYQFIRSSSYSGYVFAIHDLCIDEGEYPASVTPVGSNCWVRAEVFRSGIRYDASIGPKGRGRVSGSELELFTRLVEMGHRPVYVPAATVNHRIQESQTTLRYLVKRSFASGRGHARIFGFPPCCKRVFRIPRYLFRELCEYGLRTVARLAMGSPKVAFEHAMQCSMICGAMSEARSGEA